MPATVVQAPDPAVIHRVWLAGYNAGYGAADRLEYRRYEQEQDEMSNVPAAVIAPVPPATPAPTPIAAAPAPSGFKSLGPATPVSAGD